MKATAPMRQEQVKQEKQPCLACQKPISAPFGVFREGWVCSKVCNTAHVEKRYAR